MSDYTDPKIAALPEKLLVTRWEDPMVDKIGFSVLDSGYVETFWLPVLGPSATWLLRRFARMLGATEEVEADTLALSLALGLGAGTGRNSILARSVYRLERYGAARSHPTGLEVRTSLDRVPVTLMRSWPEFLRAQHDAGCAYERKVNA